MTTFGPPWSREDKTKPLSPQGKAFGVGAGGEICLAVVDEANGARGR
jgi:hypothetical protein